MEKGPELKAEKELSIEDKLEVMKSLGSDLERLIKQRNEAFEKGDGVLGESLDETVEEYRKDIENLNKELISCFKGREKEE